jgi:replication initiation and membrane attachment protein DnaB
MRIDNQLVHDCKTLEPMEMLRKITSDNVRGLDMIAVKQLAKKKRIPDDVFNLLIAYFYDTFGNTVYDRKDFGRVYLYWIKNNVFTFSKALEMIELDIKEVLNGIRM